MPRSGLGMLGHDHEAILEDVAALEAGKLTTTGTGEQCQADQAAKGSKAPGGLPQLPDLIIGQGGAAIAGGCPRAGGDIFLETPCRFRRRRTSSACGRVFSKLIDGGTPLAAE
jgi:hypothetical protein